MHCHHCRHKSGIGDDNRDDVILFLVSVAPAAADVSAATTSCAAVAGGVIAQRDRRRGDAPDGGEEVDGGEDDEEGVKSDERRLEPETVRRHAMDPRPVAPLILDVDEVDHRHIITTEIKDRLEIAPIPFFSSTFQE